MKIHAFRRKTKNIIAARALMRNNIIPSPFVLNALNRYLRSLNLQGRVNSGAITNTEALIEFEKAVHFFARKLHTLMDNKMTHAQKALDQSDLSNPANMQVALQNPLSYASQLMNDTAQAILDAIDEETYNNEQIYSLAQSSDTDLSSVSSEADKEEKHAEASEESSEDAAEASKSDSLIAGLVLFDEKGAEAAKNCIEAAFFEETGIKTDFHEAAAAEKDTEHLMQKILKPEFKDFHTDKDDEK